MKFSTPLITTTSVSTKVSTVKQYLKIGQFIKFHPDVNKEYSQVTQIDGEIVFTYSCKYNKQRMNEPYHIFWIEEIISRIHLK